MTWSSKELERELRRILSCSSIEVRRDPVYAISSGWHPEALQVWDRGVQSGIPYPVAVLQRKGVPCDPTPLFFKKLWDAYAPNVHQGRRSWAEQQARDSAAYQEDQERKTNDTARERFLSNRERIFSMFGHNKFWRLNRASIPRRKRQSK